MKRFLWLSAVLIAGLLAWWQWPPSSGLGVHAGADPVQSAGDSAVATQTDSDESKAVAVTQAAAFGQPQSASSPQRTAAYFLAPREDEPGFLNHPDLPHPELPPADEIKSNPTEYDAYSPQEAVWLDQHGYPSVEEVESLDSIPEEALAERASRGDLAAMALLGKKQLGNPKTTLVGYNNLNEAAMMGSVWAIIVLGDHQLSLHHYVDALALYNLAALRGDWISPQVHMVIMPDQIRLQDYGWVPARTVSFLATMQYRRKERGLPALVNTPRFDTMINRGGRDPVGVYRRRKR